MNKISEIRLKYHLSLNRKERVKISNSNSAYKVFLDNWNKDLIELQEEFKIMLLNRSNEVLGIYTLSKGSMTGTLVDLKLLFAVVLKTASCGFIMAHNHPSSNLNPSESDKRLFYKIVKASNLLDISVVDNLIISKYGYFSFVDEGVLKDT